MSRDSLIILNVIDGKEQYRVEIPDGFAALKSSDTKVDINGTLEAIRGNIKIVPRESLGTEEVLSHGSVKDSQNY
jgi:hypothetical protein